MASSGGSGANHTPRLAAAALTIATGLATLALHQPNEGPLTSYVGRSGFAAAIFVAAGIALVVAGLITSFTRPASRVGDLALLAGFLWFAPAWVGWDRGPSLVRSVATVASGFTFPVIVHLVLASPSTRVRSLVARVLVWSAYVGAALAALILALFRDPFFDSGCWANCTDNAFLVRSVPDLADWIQAADRWFVAAVAASLVAISVWRIATHSGPARRALLPVTGPGVLLGAAVVAHAIAVQRMRVENVSDLTFYAIFLAGSAAAILLSGGLVWDGLRARVQRRSVAGIGASLGEMPAPGALESALANALADPGLRIAYWLPEAGRYVDAEGHRVAEPAAVLGRMLTALVRNRRRIATVSHVATLPELEREIGAAVRLGLENERLRAEVLAQLDDLRESRARIVDAGDSERRRLERNLHDGAQQRLLAVSFDLRLARTGAHEDGDAKLGTLLSEAADEVQLAITDLRELAQGIYPAILTEAGLGSALSTLADAAPLAVELGEITPGRFPPAIETGAYFTVAESIHDSAARGASFVSVSAVRAADRLVVTLQDHGADVAHVRRSSTVVRVSDRVGALGGAVEVGPTRLRAEIPCA